MKKCILYDRECINCDECENLCDLDPKKICDNCCKCIENESNYKTIKITEIITK